MACETKKMELDVKNVSSEASILCISGEVFFGYVQASFFATCNELWASVPKEVRYWLSTGRGTTDWMKEEDMVYECCCKVLAGSELLVRWFLNQGCVPNAQLLIEAAGQGQLEVLKRCAVACDGLQITGMCPDPLGRLQVVGGDDVEEMICMKAARNGQLDVVKWLTMDGTEWKDWQTSICTSAAAGGHFDLLKWARLAGCKWDVLTSGCAAASGHLELLQWCVEKGCKMDNRTSALAARAGHLNVLEWAFANGCPWDEFECGTMGVMSGSIDVVKFLKRMGCAWTTFDLNSAALKGNVDVVEYLHKHGCNFDTTTCKSAVTGGNLEMLQWLVSAGCAYDKEECALTAAHFGHLNVMKWLFEHNDDLFVHFSVVYQLFLKASKKGDVEMLEWLVSKGCEYDKIACGTSAASAGNLQVLKWVHSKGEEAEECVWKTMHCSAASGGGHLRVLKWLRSVGCEWDDWSCYLAAKEGKLRVLKWLRSKGCPWNVGACAGIAVTNGHYDVQKWCVDSCVDVWM